MVSFKAASVLLLSLAVLADTAFAATAGPTDVGRIREHYSSTVSRYSRSLANFGQNTAGKPESPGLGGFRPSSKKRSDGSSENAVPGAHPPVQMQNHDNPNQTISAATAPLHTHTSDGIVVTHIKTSTATDSVSSSDYPPAPPASSTVAAVTPSSLLDPPHSMSDHSIQGPSSIHGPTTTARVSISVTVSTKTIQVSTTRMITSPPSASPSEGSSAKAVSPQLGWVVAIAAGVAVAF